MSAESKTSLNSHCTVESRTRLAATPPSALLNFLYQILSSESTLAACAMGLNPAIGFLHVDTPNRDSLACDLMEVCRPSGVDAFVLNWLQSEPLRKSDFWEDRYGNCRIVSSLAVKLCETADTWRAGGHNARSQA